MQYQTRSPGTTKHGHCHGHVGHGQLDAVGVFHEVCGAVYVHTYVCDTCVYGNLLMKQNVQYC